MYMCGNNVPVPKLAIPESGRGEPNHTEGARNGKYKNSEPTRKGRKKQRDIARRNIFEDHALVYSPRRIILEQTMLSFDSPLSQALDVFYINTVDIQTDKIERVKLRCQDLREYLFPRLKKFGHQIGISFEKMVYSGSLIDDTAVVRMREVDMLLIFNAHDARMDSSVSGFYHIPLRTYKDKDADKPDQYRFGRSVNGRYLSSTVVARNVYELVERALKLNTKVELEPYTSEDGMAQIRVKMKKLVVNIIPACYIEKENAYLITRPYAFDGHLNSDEYWRICYADKERDILDMMDLADRGARRKTLKILKGLVEVETTLKGISTYHLKTLLLHNFDTDIDTTPRWQRHQVELCFRTLLKQLDHHLTTGSLPHFFLRGFDLFTHFPPRLLNSLRGRVHYLQTHESELLRLLNREKGRKSTADDFPHFGDQL